jgi:hypothetical protein
MNRISFASGIVPESGPLETIYAAAAGGLKFSNVSVTINAAQLANASTWASKLAAEGITSYTLSGSTPISVAQANALLNLDSSFTLKASLDGNISTITATEAAYYAGKGLTPPANVLFDLDYVKSYVLDDGNKFASPVTVNAAFSGSTLSAADFLKLVDGGVSFKDIGKYVSKIATDYFFMMEKDYLK